MFSGKKLLMLALTGYVTASPIELHERGSNVIIGNRTVTPEHAKRYNDAGTLTADENRISTQIGLGVYTSSKPGAFPGPSNPWFCVILADSDALKRVSKAWVPEVYKGKGLWYNKKAIDDYITKDLDKSWDPAKSLRMAIVGGQSRDDVQMVIPFNLLNAKGGAMGITASCRENIEDIPSAYVNYDDWMNNIKDNRD